MSEPKLDQRTLAKIMALDEGLAHGIKYLVAVGQSHSTASLENGSRIFVGDYSGSHSKYSILMENPILHSYEIADSQNYDFLKFTWRGIETGSITVKLDQKKYGWECYYPFGKHKETGEIGLIFRDEGTKAELLAGKDEILSFLIFQHNSRHFGDLFPLMRLIARLPSEHPLEERIRHYEKMMESRD